MKNRVDKKFYVIGFSISFILYSIVIAIGILIGISTSFKELLVTFAIITSISNGYLLNYLSKKTLD